MRAAVTGKVGLGDLSRRPPYSQQQPNVLPHSDAGHEAIPFYSQASEKLLILLFEHDI